MTYDPLKNLGAKLKLPSGWKYRVTVLQKDLPLRVAAYCNVPRPWYVTVEVFHGDRQFLTGRGA